MFCKMLRSPIPRDVWEQLLNIEDKTKTTSGIVGWDKVRGVGIGPLIKLNEIAVLETKSNRL